MRDPPLILVVDDLADNREVVSARLRGEGYNVATAEDGASALARVAENPPDLILLDVLMPGMDGVEAVRRLKEEKGGPFIPVILLTSKSDSRDVVVGLDAGADDYLTKPIDHEALVARVRAVLRIKALQDQVAAQATELKDWNRTLETRVAEQLSAMSRLERLKRFLAPQVVDVVLASPDGEAALESHRREVAVCFSDLRGFTRFSETAEPEDVIALLRDYHAIVGERVFHHGGTLERFAGDAIMVLFNDPIPVPDYCLTAARLARDIVDGCGELVTGWKKRGADIGVGVGVAAGFATLGKIGFGDRFDYAAIGNVTNLAARLCAQAEAGQILVSRRVAEAIEKDLRVAFLGDVELKGLVRAVPVYELSER